MNQENTEEYIAATQRRISKFFTTENVRQIAHAGYIHNPSLYPDINEAYIKVRGFIISLESPIGVIMRIFWRSETYANIHNEFGNFNMITAMKKMEELGLIEK